MSKESVQNSDYLSSIGEFGTGLYAESTPRVLLKQDIEPRMLRPAILSATVLVRIFHKDMKFPFMIHFTDAAKEIVDVMKIEPENDDTRAQFMETVIKKAIEILQQDFNGLKSVDIAAMVKNTPLIVDMIDFGKKKAELKRVSRLLSLNEEGISQEMTNINTGLSFISGLLEDVSLLKQDFLDEIKIELEKKGLTFIRMRRLQEWKDALERNDANIIASRKAELQRKKAALERKKAELGADMKAKLEKKKAGLETEAKIEIVKAYFVSVLYSVFTMIVKEQNFNQFSAYKRITGEDLDSKIWSANLNYYRMSIDDAVRGDLAGTVSASACMEKLDEWAIHTFATAHIRRSRTETYGDIAALEVCDPGILHTRLSELKDSDEKKLLVYARKDALDEKQILKEAIVESGYLVQEYAEKANSFFQALRRGFAIMKKQSEEKKTIIGETFPVMLSRLLNSYLRAFLGASKSRFGVDENSKFSSIVIDMFRLSIERALIGYYAWMNIGVNKFIGLARNNVAQTHNNDGKNGDCVKIGTERLEKIIASIVEEYFVKYGRLFCLQLKEEMTNPVDETTQTLNSSLLNLPFSKPVGEMGKDGVQHWTFSNTTVSILSKINSVVRDQYYVEATREGTLAWVYALTEEDRERLIEKNGLVEIDGKHYFLLVYNPNADFNKTKYSHVRGAWFILKKGKGDSMRFKILSRKFFEKAFKANCMNVTVAFKQDGELVNYTYRCIPLPPTQSFIDDVSNLHLDFNDPDGRVSADIGSWAKNTMLDSETGSMSEFTAMLTSSVLILSKKIDDGLLTIEYSNLEKQTIVDRPQGTAQSSEEEDIEDVEEA